MSSEQDQHKVGIPQKPRGQQTGLKGNKDKNREEMSDTPALRGRRKHANKMFGDVSSQHVGSDLVKPSTNSPSTPAMNTSTKTNSGGEKLFKRRLAKSRGK